MPAIAMDSTIALKLALAVFMAGSLLEMGLRLPVGKALAGLRAPLLLGYAGVFGFILGPALALLIARILDLDAPYALGLVLVGLTPCAPFLPPLAKRAGGDDASVPALMLFVALVTIVLLPLVLPAISPGLSADPLRLARPLVLFIVLPLALGMLVLAVAPLLAAKIRPAVRFIALGAAVLALLLCAVIYGSGFLGAVGSHAIAALFVFLVAITAAPYLLSPGLDRDRRALLVLAMSTRNVGAALVPLFASSATDERAIVIVVLAVPMQILLAFAVAAWLSTSTSGAASSAPANVDSKFSRRFR